LIVLIDDIVFQNILYFRHNKCLSVGTSFTSRISEELSEGSKLIYVLIEVNSEEPEEPKKESEGVGLKS
jgi:hypothetical protein